MKCAGTFPLPNTGSTTAACSLVMVLYRKRSRTASRSVQNGKAVEEYRQGNKAIFHQLETALTPNAPRSCCRRFNSLLRWGKITRE